MKSGGKSTVQITMQVTEQEAQMMNSSVQSLDSFLVMFVAVDESVKDEHIVHAIRSNQGKGTDM